jgi:hypothetical protein
MDLWILIGTEREHLLHFESNTPIGHPSNFVLKSESYQDIKVPSRAAPAAFDYDNDGDIDLLIGDKNGNFCLFINTDLLKLHILRRATKMHPMFIDMVT